MKKSFLASALLLVLAVGCAGTTVVQVNPEAERVQIVTAEPDSQKCRFLKDVSGSAKGSDLSAVQQFARNDIKNKTAALGGNLVKLDTNAAGNAMDWSGRNQVALSGRAFNCKK